jgi:hypothetical protein
MQGETQAEPSRESHWKLRTATCPTVEGARIIRVALDAQDRAAMAGQSQQINVSDLDIPQLADVRKQLDDVSPFAILSFF